MSRLQQHRAVKKSEKKETRHGRREAHQFLHKHEEKEDMIYTLPKLGMDMKYSS